jgi:hypothetical protein
MGERRSKAKLSTHDQPLVRPVVLEHIRVLRKTDGWRLHLALPQLFGDERRRAAALVSKISTIIIL